MVINFLGDSITHGAGAACPEEAYVSVVGKMLGCEAKNYGIGGTRIARQNLLSAEHLYDLDFLMRSEVMGDADLVFVFGGTNDFGHGVAEFGSLDSDDIYTFCGAVNTLLTKLTARYGKDKICVILPLHRVDENNPYGDGSKKKPGKILKEYVSALETLAGKYGVDVLEFDKEFPFSQIGAGEGLTIDGLHPNSYGHKILAEKICQYVRKKCNMQ